MFRIMDPFEKLIKEYKPLSQEGKMYIYTLKLGIQIQYSCVAFLKLFILDLPLVLEWIP